MWIKKKNSSSNPNMVTAQMREGLAVSLVATFPRLAHEPISSEEKPWVCMLNICI